MGQIIKDAVMGNTLFYILSILAVIFLIASWLCPPMGVIDASVLAGVGEICGLEGILVLVKAMDKDKIAKVVHGHTEITVGKNEGNGKHREDY